MTHTGRGVRGCGLLLAVNALVSLAGCPAAGNSTISADLSTWQAFVEAFVRQIVAAWLT